MAFTISRKLAAPLSLLALLPAVAALLSPVQRTEFARAIGIPLECPAGWILESERASEEECVRAKHPESLWDGVRRRDGRLSPSSSAYAPIAEGAYRAALEQKDALSAPEVQAQVPGASGAWQPYGIGPLHTTDGSGDVSGRIDSFDYDATHGRVFATLGTGGVWMSTDKGANWSSISDNLPSQIVGSVAWSSAGPDSSKGTLVVAGGDPSSGGDDYAGLGAYWSDDLGVTWHSATGVPDGALGYKAAVDKNNPNVVYLGLSKGLFRSTDTGHSYTRIDLPVGGGCDSKYDGECYLAHFVTDVVIKTPGVTDAAPLNASPLNAPVGSVLVAVGYRAGAKPFTHDPAHVHSPGNGLYRSATGLAGSFTKLDVSAPNTASPYGFAVQQRIGRIALGPAIGPAQDHNYVYALVQDAVLFNAGYPDIDLPQGTNYPVAPPVPLTLINGLYVSPDFGSHWIRMADTMELAYNPTTESALNVLGTAQFYNVGVQGYYNLWVRPDPTVQTPGAGIPTRLMFGLEEPWATRTSTIPLNGIAQQGLTDFHVIGEYWATLHSNTTHPDQHAGVWIPDSATDATQGVAGTGVTVLIGNDGGAYTQHMAPGDEPDNDSWGTGANIGFHTLLPYAVAVAKDGTLYFGLQDNGSGHVDPADQSHHETVGGDGFFAAVDPDNSNIGYSEYTYGAIKVTTNRGGSWASITPPGFSSSTALFSVPFVMDPTDAKHLAAVGNTVAERLNGPSGSWVTTYNLGTRTSGGSTVNNIGSAIDVQGNSVYVAFCGVCDVLNKQPVGFKSGIATNVSAQTGAPAEKGVPNTGWHKPAAIGLPNRYVDDIEIDAADPRIVYVTLGGYANRGWNPPGSYGDTNTDLGTGNVYKSTDAGEHFTNISGSLPNAHATAIIKRGSQLIVGTDVGIFISSDLDGTAWSTLGSGLPVVPVAEMQLKPDDDTQLFIATFGRGFWRYTFAPTPVNTAPVASLSSDVTSGDAPLAVTFTVSGTDPDNDTLSYDLDFGDSSTHSTSSGSVSHGYAAAGDYPATLTVSDGKGGTDVKTVTIHVTTAPPVNHDPVATLSPPTATIHENEAVSFNVGATDEDGDALTVDLDFGDHSTHGSQTGIVGHTYTTAGSYTATLTVSDGRGGSATQTSSVTVQPATVGSLVVHLAVDKNGGDVSHGPVTVTFTATVENDDGTPLQYTFAFGDGETSTFTQASNVITHDYAYAGTYHPYVTATQEYGSRAATSGENEATITTTTSVAVDPVLAAKLIYDFPAGNVAPADVVFSTNGSSGDSYTLEFGDGDKTEGSGAPPASITHHYAAPQAYTAKLTVRNSSGSASDSNSQTFTLVAKQQLTALLQVSASEGTSPLEVTIDGCHSVPGNGHRIASFTVDFGDGSDPVTQTVDSAHVVDCSGADRSSDPSVFTHTYTVTSTKSFFPTLTVTDDVAASSFATYSTGVEVAAPAVAAPAASGGGGGGFGWLTLIPMFGAAIFRRRRFA